MTVLPLIIPFAVLSLCAFHDVTSFKIPNRYVAVLLAAWLPTVLLSGWSVEAIGLSAAIAGAVLLIGFALFAAGLLGAGDVKLISAAALWVPPSHLLMFVLMMAVLGGVLAVVLMKLRSGPLPAFAARTEWLAQMHERPRDMPYGVAIAGGAMIALGQSVGIS